MSSPQDRLKKYFISYANKLMLDFESILDDHPGDIGDNREQAIEIFLRQHLPPIFQIYRGGKVIDSAGNESTQADIIICNSFIPRLCTEMKTLFFVEGVMGVVECKSNLNKEKLQECVKACRELKQLNKVFEYQNEVYYKQEYSYKLDKVYFSVMAYDSPSIDTVAKNLLNFNKELEIDTFSEIDCICVINKGVMFKTAYPTFDGCSQYMRQGAKSYIFKESKFESLAYFLIQVQKEFQYIRYISFDMTKYWPEFLKDWQMRQL